MCSEIDAEEMDDQSEVEAELPRDDLDEVDQAQALLYDLNDDELVKSHEAKVREKSEEIRNHCSDLIDYHSQNVQELSRQYQQELRNRTEETFLDKINPWSDCQGRLSDHEKNLAELREKTMAEYNACQDAQERLSNSTSEAYDRYARIIPEATERYESIKERQRSKQIEALTRILHE